MESLQDIDPETAHALAAVLLDPSLITQRRVFERWYTDTAWTLLKHWHITTRWIVEERCHCNSTNAPKPFPHFALRVTDGEPPQNKP